MIKKISYYWLCQLLGWSVFILVYIFFYLSLRTRETAYFYEVLFIEAFVGLVVTHIMRVFIRRFRFVEKPINKQGFYIFFISFVFSLVYAAVGTTLEQYLLIEAERRKLLRSSIRYCGPPWVVSPSC